MASQAVFDIEMLNRLIDEVSTIPLPLPTVRASDYHGKLDVVPVSRYIPIFNQPYNGPFDYWVTRGGQYYTGPYRERIDAERAAEAHRLNEIRWHGMYIEQIYRYGDRRG